MLWEHSRAAGSTVPVDRRKQPSEVRVGNAARRDADVAGGVGELANVHLAGPPELRSITIHSSHRALFAVRGAVQAAAVMSPLIQHATCGHS